MVWISEDLDDLMHFAHRIAVMDRGVLQQYATPVEIFNSPANTFVAAFIGSPSMNLYEGTLTQTGEGASLNNLGVIYFELADYPAALEHYLASLDRTAIRTVACGLVSGS